MSFNASLDEISPQMKTLKSSAKFLCQLLFQVLKYISSSDALKLIAEACPSFLVVLNLQCILNILKAAKDLPNF